MPDAIFIDHFGPFRCEGAQEIQAQIAAVGHPVVSVHHGHQSEVELIDAAHARGIWAMSDHVIFPRGAAHPASESPMATMAGHGHYFEDYVKRGDRWLFQKVELHRLCVEATGVAATVYPHMRQVAR